MRLAGLVPLGFAAGALACRLFLRAAPSTVAIDRAQPLVVVTYWHSFGALMWLSLALAFAIASVGYLMTLHGTSNVTTIALWSALACAAALAFPVVFSSDAYAYAGYGWLAAHGLDPYAHARVLHPDSLMRGVLWQWGNPPPVCVYGPAFVWFAQAIVAALAAFGPAAPLWAFRILACAALVACAPLAYAAFAPFSARARTAAAAGIALNPIAIWSCAEGHNDVFAIALALGGFALVRAQPFAGALLLGLSPLVKLPGLIAAAGAAVWAWSGGTRSQVAIGALLGLAIAAVLARPLEAALDAHVLATGRYAPQGSLQYLLSVIVPTQTVAITLLPAAALTVAGAVKLFRADLAGAPLLALAAWLAIPNPYPWYALWILPVAFLAPRTPGAAAIVALALCTVARYYVEATTAQATGINVAIASFQLLVPAAVFIARSRRLRRDLPESRSPVPDLAISRYP